ncbi:GNAT family N-acetyltransferase [Acetobacterium paludosum]|uniref:GNAT family N-acetyltransferase n=1 Tax=Acetobacterium paludosum TaxID=52693 RepID=UPI001478DC16|nr:GNAT family N-acetyltransferase [Acetobacterium paludosum]
MKIREIEQQDLKEAVNLVNTVFNEFVAGGYSQEGQKTFRDYLEFKLEELSQDLNNGHKKMWGFYENEKIVGVIGTRDRFHISLMFVAKDHHKRKIATKLFTTVVNSLKEKENSESFEMTVNSSPYAVKIYEHLGFRATDNEQIKNGIRFTPMKMIVK